jgi:peptide/nickel transport system substrate-binding protein
MAGISKAMVADGCAASRKASKPVDAKARADAYAELQKLLRDEAPWVFLWQQHDLYGVANHIEWTPRADEKMWMYDAKVVAR